jgi:uncharacterized protein (DUF58 family)
MKLLALAVTAALFAASGPAFAAGAVKVSVLPDAAKAVVGTPTTIIIAITGAKVSAVSLPSVNGLTLNGSGNNPQRHEYNFFLTPTRAGDITIPAFDIKTDDDQTLHVDAITLHASPMN